MTTTDNFYEEYTRPWVALDILLVKFAASTLTAASHIRNGSAADALDYLDYQRIETVQFLKNLDATIVKLLDMYDKVKGGKVQP